MKRIVCTLLAIFLLAGALLETVGPAEAAENSREQIPRSIGIVFDNSGSMYVDRNSKAWCRATYAIEVFATMLNDGDLLSVYPMEEILIDNTHYDMNNPVTISGPDQASVLRKIYTPQAKDTPIEAIDAAYNGLKNQAGEKWLIVLTDGATFYENEKELTHNTREKLDERLGKYAQEMNVLYLGIGESAAMPTSRADGPFRLSADQATNSEEVLSRLTAMCNMIFGRDTLPENYFHENQMNFDVSMNKLIVFVQGENVADVSVTDASGKLVGTLKSEYEPHYSEQGAGNYSGRIDKSLQGMVVIYTGCAAGTYTLNYSGKASSTEIYYEPNVDLVFSFTDDNGLPVNPDALYEGNYSVGFGMKDALTGEFTNSDLLGNTRYLGHYYINGEEFPIECNEKSGNCTVPLKMGDSFDADMIVEYLNGYQIYKNGQDFNWPQGGLSVAARPAGNLELRISGGDSLYHLATLEQGAAFTAEVYYKNELLTGAELEKVELLWDPEQSGASLEKVPQEDHYEIVLSHKDPSDPEATAVGMFKFPITAQYTPPGSYEVGSLPAEFSYAIDDVAVNLDLNLQVQQGYYQISRLGEGKPLRVEITGNGQPLPEELLDQVRFEVDCGGLPYTVKKLSSESAYEICLETDDRADPGKYKVSCSAVLEDGIGRCSEAQSEGKIKLGKMALLLKWLLIFLVFAVLLILLLLVLHIKAVPKHLHATKKECNMNFDGENETANTKFSADLKGGRLQASSAFAGKKFGLQMDGKPAPGSYVKTPQIKRKVEVSSKSVKKFGCATIQEATVGTVRFVFNEDNHKLERVPPSDKPFVLKNGDRIAYSGFMQREGEQKSFNTTIKLRFKKK